VAEALRVAHLGTETGWRGGEQQQAWLAAGLQDRGHPCLMICRTGGEMCRRAPGLGLEVRPIRVRGELGLRSVLGSASALRGFRPDVLHLHDAHAVLIGALAAAFARVPAVVVSRRVDFRINSLRKYTWAADRIIAISEAVRAVLLDCGVPSELVSVVPSGIDLERFERMPERAACRRELNLAADAPAVGCVAALTDHKGHRFLLEAWPRVLEAQPAAVLLLAGSGELEAKLRKQSASLGVNGSVRFLGYREDLPQLLAALDVFVLASHLEGLCTSLMDAMAAGLPVVATSAGGIPEVVQDRRTGMLVPPRDPRALAAALVAVLADGALRARFGRAGREAVRRFDRRNTVERTLEVYRQVLDSKGRL
jgi:glycosyltransferase involved in cell wall biosynthesis